MTLSYLALVYGITYTSIGLHVLLRPFAAAELVTDVASSRTAVYLLGVLSILCGASILAVEWRVTVDLPGLVVCTGWLALLKGLIRVFAHSIAVRSARKVAASGMLQVWGFGASAWGAGLLWYGWPASV